jgi:hypothetical protein
MILRYRQRRWPKRRTDHLLLRGVFGVILDCWQSCRRLLIHNHPKMLPLSRLQKVVEVPLGSLDAPP